MYMLDVYPPQNHNMGKRRGNKAANQVGVTTGRSLGYELRPHFPYVSAQAWHQSAEA